MKILLKEQQNSPYVYINPKSNIVHLIMPIMSGTDIGLDNTCKSAFSLQEFFGLAGINRKNDALSVLHRYDAALVHDIKYMPESHERVLKAERLEQIRQYIWILRLFQENPLIQEPLKEVFPRYPEPLQYLMKHPASNLYSIILRPTVQDLQLRTTAIRPIFSLPHSEYNKLPPSLFHEALMDALSGVSFKVRSKEKLVELVVIKLANQEVDFDILRNLLSAEIKSYLGIDFTFSHTQGNPHIPSEAINQAYIDDQLGIDEDNPATHAMYAEALIEYCAPHLFEIQADSPFSSIENSERLSIAIQQLLAEINIHCYEQGLSEANFGQLLEGDIELSLSLHETIRQTINGSYSVEDATLNFVNQHYQDFQMKAPLTAEQMTGIKQEFKAHYEQVKKSPHFDEFVLLRKKPGLFFAHQGCIATTLALFLNPLFFKINDEIQAFLDKRLFDFIQIEKANNTLPHKNTHIPPCEMVIDLDALNYQILQNWYANLIHYSDNEIKSSLLAQIKQELPNFEYFINATEFLQTVAYGQQESAEHILVIQPNLVRQKLLKAHNQVFTDYSGRTFSCTGYEYAYWAKDAHMMRMLEKFMDEETKAFILDRILTIETPVKRNALTSFFANPNAFFKRNKGLNYTTQNAKGETIHHNETHFSLKPLKNALKKYIKIFNQSPRVRHTDWVDLDPIWVKEVGGAQWLVPAHIAQEYCQRGRSFKDVTKHEFYLNASNPDNLIRRFRINNTYTTGIYDHWFIPNSSPSLTNLGFLFAISRAGRMDFAPAMGLGRMVSSEHCSIDLDAIRVIDKVRTRDLQQSHANLQASSLNAQISSRP